MNEKQHRTITYSATKLFSQGSQFYHHKSPQCFEQTELNEDILDVLYRMWFQFP